MAKFTWSEIFSSIEGEAIYAGRPTTYLRFAKCNFTCAGFNNPANKKTKEGYAPLTFNPKDYSSLQQLPLIECGCDSQYSVNKEFEHMWFTGDENKVVEELLNTIPHKSWIHPTTNQPVIFSITGGEPLLFQKQIIVLLNHPLMEDCQHILIETNCSVPLRSEFVNALNSWWKPGRKITFSNSPKLRASGEKWEDAIKPEVAVAQQQVKRGEQYFKFVCGPNEEEFEEVGRAMQEYWNAGVIPDNNVFIMPMSCVTTQQDTIAADVARMCIERGLTYCHRVHLDVWGNKVGT
jgi:organic radical activating enzyme